MNVVLPATALFALLCVACDGGAAATSGGTAPVPTVATLDQLSLTPARETADPAPIQTADPAPIETPGELPPIPPPEGVPPPPPEVTLEYTSPADDLAGFVAAYRETFAVTELSDDAIAAAGARLCSYLLRHATANGSVDVVAAITDADVHEPGYPRDVWRAAFELATAHYCGELSLPTAEA